MKSAWPTLKGRLDNALNCDIVAIEQLQASGHILSEYAKRILKKARKKKINL